MKITNLILGSLLFAATLCTTGCVVGTRGAYGNSGYVRTTVPNAVNVSHYPPAPVVEAMTPSPGYGHVWIDGNWHWNNYQWAWIRGRWEYPRANYVYVAPYYDFVGNNHVYVRGYWSPRNRVPQGYRYNPRRANRPFVYRRPVRAFNPYVHGRRGYQTPRGWNNNNRFQNQRPRRVQPRNTYNPRNNRRPGSPFTRRPGTTGNPNGNRGVGTRPGINQTTPRRPGSPFTRRPGSQTNNRPVTTRTPVARTPNTSRLSPNQINRVPTTRYTPVPTRRVVVRRNPSAPRIDTRAPARNVPNTSRPSRGVNRGNLNSPIRRRDQ